MNRRAQKADDAVERLKEALNDISGDSSIADAAGQALTAIQSFSAALQSIDDSISCEQHELTEPDIRT